MATGVVVQDALPAGLVYVSDDPSSGTYNEATGLWEIGLLSVGETVSLEIVVEVTGVGPYENVAEVVAVDQPDPDSTPDNDDPTEDDQDSVTIGGEQIDLELTKTASATEVFVGDLFEYTLTITNQGPSDATGVVVFDNLPSGVSYAGDVASAGTYSLSLIHI